MIHRPVLLEQLRLHGSFYLYDGEAIRASVQRLQAAFPEVRFLYSVKCNPAGRVLDTVFSAGLGADAASPAEVELAAERGLPPERVCFSAPARTEADFRRVWGKCLIMADSLRELELLSRIAAEQGETASVGVRLNPDITFTADVGAPSKFGIDEELFFAEQPRLKALPGLRLSGVHIHLQSQELDAAVLSRYYGAMFRLAERVQAALGAPLDFVNFGSGLGIPYAPEDRELDLEAVGARFSTALERFRKTAPDTRVFLETGRYAVGKSGVYVTRVLEKKVSRGRTYLLLDGTLNGFFRPALNRLVRNYTEHPFPCEPLFTCPCSEEFIPLTDAAERETVTLAGNLCTAADAVAEDVELPRMEVGDGLLMTNAGCYAAVLTPMQFGSLKPPVQLFLTAAGAVEPAG